MKMHNLTWSCAWIDPNGCWIKGFLFREVEEKIWHSKGNFTLFFWQNLDFKYTLDAEMSLEEEEIKRFKDWVV